MKNKVLNIPVSGGFCLRNSPLPQFFSAIYLLPPVSITLLYHSVILELLSEGVGTQRG